MIILLATNRLAGGNADLSTQPGLGTPMDFGGELDQTKIFPLPRKRKRRKQQDEQRCPDQGSKR